MYREPLAVLRTRPAVRDEMVVEPLTLNLPVMEVVAKEEVPVIHEGPETVRAEVEALVEVMEVKVGVEETAKDIPEVVEITMLDPAFRFHKVA